MDRFMDSVDKATGITWSALVTQQVFYGLGMVLLAVLSLIGLYFIFKKITIRNMTFNISIVMLFFTVISIALLGYGFMHVFNPGYYALNEIKDGSFQLINEIKR
ncbi:membrane protein [Staphylococcus phage vB_StaM_SA1]|nr:membrane protein [Staphylococcus phage vB_StaM_SA1]